MENEMEKKYVLEINHASKAYRIENEEKPVLDDIDLKVREGEFISIVGKSGCGKSTLLRLIAGLEKPTSGEILIDGTTDERKLGQCKMAFQEARLFPWMNVRQNIAFGLEDARDKKKTQEIVSDYIDLIGLQGFEGAKPSQLSGGMQQRVSIARALISKPRLLMLDEPFGALDAFTRITMQNEILKIWEHEKCTMVLVTHDIDEAIYLSDRIVILSEHPGRIEKIINVDLFRPRDRSRNEFLEIRKKILQSFLGSTEINVEYYI